MLRLIARFIVVPWFLAARRRVDWLYTADAQHTINSAVNPSREKICTEESRALAAASNLL
jgi:hypothetical protein